MTARPNRDALYAFLAAVADFGAACCEMRVFNATLQDGFIRELPTWKKTLGGWYTDPDSLYADVGRLQGVSAYLTLNPVCRDLIARSNNRLAKLDKDGAKGPQGTRDGDIRCIRWLYLDIDPVRPSGVSATDAERESALAVQAKILADHPEIKASALWGCSGNGGWILVRVPDLANDGAGRDLAARFLRSLAAKYSTPAATVDVKTVNPSRVMCLPGTLKCKGENCPEVGRVWRFVTFDSWEQGHPLEVGPIDLAAWLVRHEVVGPPAPVAAQGGPARNGRVAGDPAARIRAYLATKEPAVAGQNGHGKTFDVAMDLVQGFDLGIAGARPYLEDYNARCVPPWAAGELEHKLEEADRKADDRGRPRGWLRDADRNGHADGHRPVVNLPGIPAAQAGQDVGPRVQVVIRPDIPGMVDEAEYVLSLDGRVYQRSNVIVTTVRDEFRPKCLRVEGAMPRIVPMEPETVREVVARHADWVNLKPDKDSGDLVAAPANPPEMVAPTLIARKSWPHLRHLVSVIESPVMREDGSILDKPGYDPETAILFEPNVAFAPVPDRPGKGDAEAAAARIYDLVDEFPFCGPVHRAAWMAALLTPFARYAIDGPCPLFFFDANNPGSGKSKLTDVISYVTMGRSMPRTAYPGDDDEMLKNITSIALAAQRIVLIDNIRGPFGGAPLEAALTARTWNQRILGASKMTGDLPLYTVWYATGNNVSIAGDIFRRMVYSRIEVADERPEERSGFKYPKLEEFARTGRAWLVRDCLTILRAFHLADRPTIPGNQVGYPEWSDLIRSAVWWLTGVDCWANHDQLRQSDPESSTSLSVIEGWRELQSDLDPDEQARGITAAEMLALIRLREHSYDRLRNALLEWSRTSDLPTPRQVGIRLKQIKDRVFNGHRMHSHPYQGTQYWSVRPSGDPGPEPETPRGTGDCKGLLPGRFDPLNGF